MLRTKRQRDQAAGGLIMAIPIVLIVVVVTIVMVRRNNPTNPESPYYVSPASKSASEVAACEASRSSRLETLTYATSSIFVPMVDLVDYMTVLGFGGANDETTTWAIATKEAVCNPYVTALPEPYLTYTIGPLTAAYNWTTTSYGETSEYLHPETITWHTSVETTMNVQCNRHVYPAKTWTYGGGISFRVWEESTASVMDCTKTWHADVANTLGLSTGTSWKTFGDGACGYYCNYGIRDATIVGGMDGLIPTTTTATMAVSETRTQTSSMVTETRRKERSVVAGGGTGTVTMSPGGA